MKHKSPVQAKWMYVGLGVLGFSVLFLFNRSENIVFLDSNKSKITLAPTPVERYAPELRLHPDETYFPIDIGDFVSHSKLGFAHDLGCADTRIDAPPDFRKLGSGEYEVRQKGHSWFLFCKSEGRAYSSNEFTRPFGDLKRPAGLSAGEGFYLDLDNRARHGAKPVNDRIHVPMYYNYEPGRYITYWFMYGHDPKMGPFGRFLAHEGDWERLTVRLNKDDVATQVDYFQHGCPAETYSWPAMQTQDFLTQKTHPIAYAAKGTHATFPTPIRLGYWPFKNSHSCPGELTGVLDRFQGNGDVAADDGPRWRGWEVQLTDAETQGWYGFGGAWGEVGGFTTLRDESTGQPGPPHRDPGLTRF